MTRSTVSLASSDELWELVDSFNSLGYGGSFPVISANDIFWMAYPYEDGDQIYVGMESGDPRERFMYDADVLFYPVITCNDPIIIYPLKLLWVPMKQP